MNFTQWLQVGKSGFTFPTSTEHGAVCQYSREKVLCEMSAGCQSRIPSGSGKVCLEVDHIKHIP